MKKFMPRNLAAGSTTSRLETSNTISSPTATFDRRWDKEQLGITRGKLRAIFGLLLLLALPGAVPRVYAPVSTEPLNPTNFASLGPNPFTTNGTYTVHSTGTPQLLSPANAVAATGVVSNGVAVFTFDDINIGSGTAVLGARETNSRPIALLSHGEISIGGTNDVSGADGVPVDLTSNIGGAGGAAGPGGGGGGGGGKGAGESNQGIPVGEAGPGGAGLVNGSPGADPSGSNDGIGGTGGNVVANGAGKGGTTGGGGGAFGGNGNAGNFGGAGGTSYGNLMLELQAGSGGGGGGGAGLSGGGGGGGGGAVELGAVSNIFIGGSVAASGGAGGNYFRQAGGGAGGGILVHGRAVIFSDGSGLRAAGGGGNGDGGGGGGGRIYIAASFINFPGTNLNAFVNVAGGSGARTGQAGSGVITTEGMLCPELIIVTTTEDGGPGSLRQAILDANACPGKNTIEFAPSAYGTITLTNGELAITGDLDIFGPGATNVIVDGNYPNTTNRVFHVTPSNIVTIAGLTITNGSVATSGGGIFNDHSTLTVSNCTVSGNRATGDGGGILSDASNSGTASMTIVGSAIAGNSAGNFGGGINNDGSGGHAELTVINSTVSGNSSAASGGGLGNEGLLTSGVVTILNSTLSSNSAAFLGNGIFNFGAVGSHSATVTMGSSILDNSAIGNQGTFISLGYNLSNDGGGGVLTNSTDQLDADPLLGPLQLNGGQTPTHALMCGSPAIDKGTNFFGLAFDQRGPGFARTAGAATDIGAFELQTLCNHPPVAICTNVTVSAGSNCTATASIDGGSYDPDAGDMITFSQSPAAPYGLGTNIVTLTVTDNHGASNSCVGMVIVVDKTAPTINCPSNIVTTNDSGQCSAVVYYTVTATDNCGSVTNITEDFTSGSMFSTGTNTVHVTAVDNAGNTNTCSFTITVLDTEAPVVGCVAAPNPAGKVFEPGKNASAGSNPNGYYQLRAKDNCDAESALLIYVYDTGSGFVAGPFHSGNIVRVQHGSTPSSAPGSAPVVAVLRLVQDGLVYAQDTSGNVTPGANRCLLPVSIK